MHPYLKFGLKLVASISLSLLVPCLLFLWSILIFATVARCYIDREIFLGTLALIPGLAAYIFTAVMILVFKETWPEWLQEWMLDLRADMSSLRRQRLERIIGSLKPVYRKYRIYPELKIYQDYRKY